MSYRGFVLVSSVLFLLLFSPKIRAVEKDYLRKPLAKYLPKYCSYTQDGNYYSAPSSKYRQMFGEDPWQAMHHYCRGLYQMNKAFYEWNNEQDRRYYLVSGIDEFNYILRHSDSRLILLAEIFFNKGKALLLLGNEMEGIRAIQQAIRVRPNYVPPYLMLGDYFITYGKKKQARLILEKGLEHSGSQIIKEKLRDLDKSSP